MNIYDLKSINNAAQLADITQQGTIKGFAVKTQAEYDALPASKTTDGIVYLIRG